jgi:Inner membrane protein YgaP-like, transmembrane domain
MLSNMGKADRLIRTAAAFVIVFGSIYFSGLWAILGVLILLTAVMGWCPIYALFHVSTSKDQVEIPSDTSGEQEPRRGPKRLLK